MYYAGNQRRGRGCVLVPLLVVLVIAGGLGFLVYRSQAGGSITVGPHPSIIGKECSGTITVRAGSQNNVVVLSGIFPLYRQDTGNNLIVLDNSCADMTLIVPPQTDLTLDADNISVFGVSGQMDLTTNGGLITLVQSTLEGQSTLDNNGGAIRMSGTFDARSTPKISSNGGSIDLTLPANASFHLDVTGIIESITTDFPGIQQAGDTGLHVNVGSGQGARLTLDGNGTQIVMREG